MIVTIWLYMLIPVWTSLTFTQGLGGAKYFADFQSAGLKFVLLFMLVGLMNHILFLLTW